MTQQQRTRRHIRFIRLVKRTKRTLSNAWTTPFNPNDYNGYSAAHRKYSRMPEHWQLRIDRSVDAAIFAYHEPKVKGRDGRMYSEAEMDTLLMRY